MPEKVDLEELARYLRLYQENPASRVFAPLADLYRRLGRLDEAIEVVRDGLRRHPYYAGGRVALAHIFFDQGQAAQAVQELEQVVTYYPDNLLARKILIKALASQGLRDRAEKEWSLLSGMAPDVARDPELESWMSHGLSEDTQGGVKVPVAANAVRRKLQQKKALLEGMIARLGSH